MRYVLLAGLVFVSILVGSTPASGQTAPAPVISRVFGPETPTGPYKHPACLTELSNGDLYLVYYGGQGEYARDTTVFGARLKKATGQLEDTSRLRKLRRDVARVETVLRERREAGR